jgi:hypothetical protein
VNVVESAMHSEKFNAVDGAKVEETLAGRSKAAERDGTGRRRGVYWIYFN